MIWYFYSFFYKDRLAYMCPALWVGETLGDSWNATGRHGTGLYETLPRAN